MGHLIKIISEAHFNPDIWMSIHQISHAIMSNFSISLPSFATSLEFPTKQEVIGLYDFAPLPQSQETWQKSFPADFLPQ